MPMQKYLAIDYGTKRVGLAINHEWLAEPLKIVPQEKALEEIISLVEQEKINTILIGIADGSVAELSRSFGKTLRERLKQTIQIIEVDETLSSVETHERLVHSSMPRKRRQENIDHYAAAAILQEYIDTHPSRE